MIRAIAGIRVAIAATLLSIPIAVHAQTADPMGDKSAVDKLMHDYIETWHQAGPLTRSHNTPAAVYIEFPIIRSLGRHEPAA